MRLTGHANTSRNARPLAGGARVGKRKGDRGVPVDAGTHRFVVGAFNAFAIVAMLVLIALAIATVFWMASAKGQVLVSMQRGDPEAGMQEIECILVHRDNAAQILTGALLIDCMGDAEVIFHNSFEAVPHEAE